MSTPDSLRWLKRYKSLGYSAALLSVATALFIALLLQLHYGYEPWNPFLCAILFSALFGGVKPGLFAGVLSLLAFHYFFLAPIYPAGMEKEIPRLLAAALTALFLVLLSAVQRRTTTALQESERRFRQIAENIHEVFWLATIDFSSILYVSPAYEAVWGRSCKSLYQDPRSFIAAIHPQDRARVLKVLERERERGFEIEYRVVKPDGSIRWIWDRGFPIKDAAARVYRLAGIAEDITDRKLAAEAVSQAEHRGRLIIDTIPTMAWSVQPDGAVDFMNQRWLDYTGLTMAEAIANPTSTIHPEDLPVVMATWRADMATGATFEREMRLRRADGEYRWFLIRTAPLRDAQGNIIKWFGSSFDIEDRKRGEDAIRQSQQLLESVLTTLPIGVVVTNQAGDIILGNAASKAIWGQVIISGSERRENSTAFWHETGRRVEPADWASVRALTKGETSLGELLDIETFNGQLKTILNSAAPIRNAGGQIVGTVIVNEDVTEAKKSEDKLRRAQAELAHVARVTIMGELTASIAHEVNQPLAAVVTNANAASRWLAADPPNLDEARAAVKRIARDGARSSEVIRRIRTLMKKSEPSRTPVNLNELIKETVALTQPELKDKKVSLRTELSPRLPRVQGDRVQLQQVLLNLFVNAADSLSTVSGRPRMLGIHTERTEPNLVRVVVQDTGAGIKPDEVERIFEPFHSTKPHGLGMGLAISRSIIEAHGGRLWATPNGGHGATFEFTLPAPEGGGP